MIRIVDVSIQYKNVLAVNNFSLEIKPGKIYGLVGPNGAGKSSLIKAMVGIISEYEGEIFYNDLLLRKNRYEVKKILGYAPENVDLIPYLTGQEFIQMISDIRNLNNSDKQVSRFFSLLNMDKKKDELINSYSHGMLQKLSVAAAMTGMPEFLIFDEAFNGLDPVSLFNLKEMIQNHALSGGTVLISSHILELIEKWCSTIIVMNNGKILAEYEQDGLAKLKTNTGKDFNEIFVDFVKKDTDSI